jgi:hypothetical protein
VDAPNPEFYLPEILVINHSRLFGLLCQIWRSNKAIFFYEAKVRQDDLPEGWLDC